MKHIDLVQKLKSGKQKTNNAAENVIIEVNKILNENLYSKKNVLHNLKHYNKSFELIDEEDVDTSAIYSTSQIRALALNYRLRFLDSQHCKSYFPYESVLKIEHLNIQHKKALAGFKVLSTDKFFKDSKNTDVALLFAPTNLGNYYLIHKWGTDLKWHRKLFSWPLKNIETLFVSLIIFTFIVTMCLPTNLITLDHKATYWCAYRIGVFFHLLIFFMGFTAYFTFAFSKNLSSSIWNRYSSF
jgi:hypothetical protein